MIKNRVWIGNRALIMKGVFIGDDAAIAAGSVVTKSTAAMRVYVGVPAKPVKYRS